MKCSTKEARVRQGRSVVFDFKKGCLFDMIANWVTASIGDSQYGLCNLFHVGKYNFHIAKADGFLKCIGQIGDYLGTVHIRELQGKDDLKALLLLWSERGGRSGLLCGSERARKEKHGYEMVLGNSCTSIIGDGLMDLA
eukprot:13446672-Ditylum_brightwellii.AAC.1